MIPWILLLLLGLVALTAGHIVNVWWEHTTNRRWLYQLERELP